MEIKWPNDADGEMLAALVQEGFDLSQPQTIEFMVEFKQWPPAPEALRSLGQHYDEVMVISPEEDDEQQGYVLVLFQALVTHELVVEQQQTLTELVQQYEGYCDAWSLE